MERRKEVRLEHIADAVGVSIVTVSNALNGRKGVSDELRDKICSTALALGYQMTKPGSGKKQNTGRIGVVTASRYVERLPSVYMDMYRRIARELNRKGSQPVLEVVDENREQMPHRSGGFPGQDFVGIIMIGELSRAYIRWIRKEYQIPIVCVDFYDVLPDMDYITGDNFGGKEQMTKLLLDAGCTRLMFAGSPESAGCMMDRYLGYCKALEQRGIEAGEEDVISDSGPAGSAGGFLAELPEIMPQAFVCGSDRTADILIGRLLERGIRIPEEVSVTGFDHYYSGIYEGMRLTTYETDWKAMAQITVSTILGRISGQKKAEGIRFVAGRIISGNTVRPAEGSE